MRPFVVLEVQKRNTRYILLRRIAEQVSTMFMTVSSLQRFSASTGRMLGYGVDRALHTLDRPRIRMLERQRMSFAPLYCSPALIGK